MAMWDINRIFVVMRIENENLSDQEILEGLINRDNRITEYFFWEKCNKVFGYIIKNLYLSHPNKKQLKDSLIRDLYAYLMEKDAKVLRGFHYESKLTTWLTTVAYRHFKRIRDAELKESGQKADTVSIDNLKEASNEDFEVLDAKIVVDRVLDAMPNQDYAYIIRRTKLENCSYNIVAKELNKSVNYLYNLRNKVWAMFVETYFKIEDDYE